MTDRYSEYDNWAWLYNKTLGPSYAAKKLPVLRRVLLSTMRPNARLLDLCCGTGQLAELLVDEGFQVTGVDGSELMLKFARRNAPAADFLLADARSFEATTKFDGACCISASLNHVESIADLKRVFGRVSRVLQDNAVFVFDVNPPASMQARWRGNALVGGIEEDHAWLATTRYDAASARGSFTIDIYRAPNSEPASTVFRVLTAILKAPRLEKTRLSVLKRFGALRPKWKHSSLTYAVYGHELESVESAVKECGFKSVSIQGAYGGSVEKDGACFVCVK